MRVYHRTYHSEAILREGFRDGEGCYLTDRLWRGVWISDRPLDENAGADGDVVLTLEIPDGAFRKYEWCHTEPAGYREALVPADVLNAYGPAVVWEEPDFAICTVMVAGGSICGAEAQEFDWNRYPEGDPRRYLDLCEKHAASESLVLDEETQVWCDRTEATRRDRGDE